jgi:hypothetical protein
MEPTTHSKNSKGLEGEYRTVSLFIDNAKTYIQLSTGALLLSVTFIQGITGTNDLIPIDGFILIPWCCWLLTILIGVTYQYCVVKYLEKLEEKHETLIEPRVKEVRLLTHFVTNPYQLYGFMMICFYLGTLFFAGIAVVNVIRKLGT